MSIDAATNGIEQDHFLGNARLQAAGLAAGPLDWIRAEHPRGQLVTGAFVCIGQGRLEKRRDFGFRRAGIDHPNDGKSKEIGFICSDTAFIRERSGDRMSPPRSVGLVLRASTPGFLGPLLRRRAVLRFTLS